MTTETQSPELPTHPTNSDERAQVQIRLLDWSKPFFDPSIRYHVIYGGRAAGRSYQVALALLLIGMQQRVRILVVREFANSLSDSVHAQLADLIRVYLLHHWYTVQTKTIVGKNGTTFLFKGVNMNPDSLRSFTNIDICWAEEADAISRRTWEILLPTLRNDNVRFYITFNPSLTTSATWQIFVKNRLPRSRIYYQTYLDNPHASTATREQAEHMRLTDYPKYQHIYLGQPLSADQHAVFAEEFKLIDANEQIIEFKVNYDLPTYIGVDIGYTDMTVLWFIQRINNAFAVVDYYANSDEVWQHYLQAIKASPYRNVTIILPHDARQKHASNTSGASIQEQTRDAGFYEITLDRTPIDTGIDAAKSLLRRSIFRNTAQVIEGVNAMRQYAWAASKAGDIKRQPLHNHASHVADAWRTAALYLVSEHNNSRRRYSLHESANSIKVTTIAEA